MSKKVIVAMSGGVDSSVALLLLKEQGYAPIGVMMKLFDNDHCRADSDDACDSLRNIKDARGIAESMGIPFHVFDFTEDFKHIVISHFVDSYIEGATPNPCIVCNRYLKFNKLFSCMYDLGADNYATGHYARIEYDNNSGRYLLKKALDESKDQSYVLYNMTQEQLKHTIFPLGNYSKPHVREIAGNHGFKNANKSDSQDICFIRDGDYVGFIERITGKNFESGNFIDTNGNILGHHNGLIRYTVGQRKGLGISLNKPMYVLSKNVTDNTVTLCEDNELFSKTLDAAEFNWIAYDKVDDPIRAMAKIRYAHTPASATVTPTSESTVNIEFDKPQRAIAKGQAVVLYDGETVIGGGTII